MLSGKGAIIYSIPPPGLFCPLQPMAIIQLNLSITAWTLTAAWPGATNKHNHTGIQATLVHHMPLWRGRLSSQTWQLGRAGWDPAHLSRTEPLTMAYRVSPVEYQDYRHSVLWLCSLALRPSFVAQYSGEFPSSGCPSTCGRLSSMNLEVTRRTRSHPPAQAPTYLPTYLGISQEVAQITAHRVHEAHKQPATGPTRAGWDVQLSLLLSV